MKVGNRSLFSKSPNIFKQRFTSMLFSFVQHQQRLKRDHAFGVHATTAIFSD
jgi:hypothetical protein